MLLLIIIVHLYRLFITKSINGSINSWIDSTQQTLNNIDYSTVAFTYHNIIDT
jgi:hypothetical protein